MGTPGAPFGPPFDIPDFTISGILPPFLGSTATDPALMSPYETSLVRIAGKLCGSPERKEIFRGLLKYRQELVSLGFTDGFQWLSGSFMEDIEKLETRQPRDVDLVTFCHRPAAILDDAAWATFVNANVKLLLWQLVKPVYKCDAYFVDLNTEPENIVNQARYWFGLFSHRRTGIWKGLLQIPLAVTKDDADASLSGGAVMLKIQRDQLAAQLATLNYMLQSLPANDYLARMGFEARREELQRELASLGVTEEHRAQIALYFGGDPVIGSAGVQATFGTNVVGTFQDLLSKVWGGLDSPLAPMGPIKDKEASQLHITSVVHGSFGFLLEELDDHSEPMFQTPLSAAADQVATYIASFAGESEASFMQTIDVLNPRVFQAIRQFFAFVHKGGATFRLVEGEFDHQFDHLAVERAWNRAEASDVVEDEVHIKGRLLGVIPMKRRFELESDETGTVIEGRVGEKFGNTYLEHISTQQFAGKRWSALLHKRTVTKVGREPADNYTLVELEEIPGLEP
jgi:hypothetical protein